MMKKSSSIYKPFDIVVVPFPFVDSLQTKNRPAMVISAEKTFNLVAGHTVLAMITSSLHQQLPLDTPITHFDACGLLKPSIVRLKLFTIDNSLIKSKIGALVGKDKMALKKNVKIAFKDLI